jgi:hypothetical protein
MREWYFHKKSIQEQESGGDNDEPLPEVIENKP